MDEERFRQLVRIAVEAESFDDSQANDPRTPSCLSMGRIETIAKEVEITAAERDHLTSCDLCSGRLRAFKRLAERFGATAAHPTRKATRAWNIGLTTAALAAVIALFVLPWQLWFSTDFGIEISSLHRVARSEGRVVREFGISSTRPSFAVVVFRTWDRIERRLDWVPPGWKDGDPRTQLTEAPVLAAIDVTEDPPVEQAIVVAASKSRSVLPESEEGIKQLFACLRQQIPPAASDDAPSPDYTAALRHCLPDTEEIEILRFRHAP